MVHQDAPVTRQEAMRVLEDPLAQELLHSPHPARLAYGGLDGYPRVIPVGYYWDGDHFFVCTATNAPKVAALRANPKVALTVDTETQPPRILLVRGTATLEVVDGVPDEFLEASRKYIPPDDWQAFETQTRGLYPNMARISITPEWSKLIDFETRLPEAVANLIAQHA
jgi:nitroimidazol reductase NimA-like FMN-containing flavoprotein (pyridoxamine 5'-phosphate oxidase superfamily)